MREREERGMKAVEIEVVEKVRAISQSSLQLVLDVLGISSNSVPSRTCQHPSHLDRCLALKSLMTPGESSVERTSLNSLTLTPKSISAKRMGGARRSSPPAGQILTKRCESRIT